MANSRDWESIGNYISQIQTEGLSYKEGAKRFGLKVSDIYEYNKRFKKWPAARGPGKGRNWTKIGEYVALIEKQGMSYVDGAAHFGISLSTIYKYNSQIKRKIPLEPSSKRGGSNGVQLESGAASTTVNESPMEESPGESSTDVDSSASDSVVNVNLAPGVADLILTYRHENPDHGYKRIEDHLKNRYFVVVPRKKIRELLKSHGLTGDRDSSFDKSSLEQRAKGMRRFEASYPRELYQMDITYVYLVNQTICYLVVIVDDNSRFCVACELRRDYRGISMIEVLHRAIERYGKPSKLLTDQGSSFYSWSREQTLFSRYLDDMKIEHIVADPHSPQTLGKVERFNQTIQRELLNKSHLESYEEARHRIESYMHHYNYERPHQGIGGTCPANRFQGVISETSRIETELSGSGFDFSRGYLVFKMFEHSISIVCNGGGLQVLLNGDLLTRSSEASLSDTADKAK
jgi:transposase InsO family protein/transposase